MGKQQQVVVAENKGRTFLKSTYNKALVGVAVALPLVANAELDMSEATTQMALGLGALGVIGAAKLGPNALAWVWGLVTSNMKRG